MNPKVKAAERHRRSSGRARAKPNHRATTTYHEAVRWFKGLGYTVEPGPGVNEVTLINAQRPDFIAHHTVPVNKLAGMADLSRTITAQQIFRPFRMKVRKRL